MDDGYCLLVLFVFLLLSVRVLKSSLRRGSVTRKKSLAGKTTQFPGSTADELESRWSCLLTRFLSEFACILAENTNCLMASFPEMRPVPDVYRALKWVRTSIYESITMR